MRRSTVRRLLAAVVRLAPCAALLGAGCPPAPGAAAPEVPAVAPPQPAEQNPDLVAARQRLLPYDVAQGTTVYAIRDLLAAAAHTPAPRDRAEAEFLAAAATLDIVLYGDLAADDRPIAGLRDAWGATDRDGIVAAVDARLAALHGSFLPLAEQNARALAAALRTPAHDAGDPAVLAAIAAIGGPEAFAVRILLLDVDSRLLDAAAAAGSAALLAAAPALAAGLPDPAGDDFAGLDDAARSAARLLAFAATNAAAVRAASADEPLAALLGPWIDARRLDERPLSFARPLGPSDFPDGGTALPRVPFAGLPPAARAFAWVGPTQLVLGMTDEVQVRDGTVAVVHAALGDAAASRLTCTVPEPLPVPPRRFTCVQGALAAVGAAGGGARLLLAGAETAPLPVVVALLREAVASGVPAVEAVGRGPDGALTAFPLAFQDDRSLAAGAGTVRIAQGGFYVGRRGELTQLPRESGAYDYAGLAHAVRGREPPFVLAPADTTPYAVFLGALSALSGAAAASGGPVALEPPGP